MSKLGKRQLTLTLQEPMTAVPAGLSAWPLTLRAGGNQLEYVFDARAADGAQGGDIPALLRKLGELGVAFKDLQTRQSSLEDIFVDLVHAPASPTLEVRP
jgi:ABC-2 type transport system ATP-binding protein